MSEKKYHAFALDIDTYIEIVELAQKNGKKPGDDMNEELIEIMEKKKGKIKYLGSSDKDSDLLTGELRERGIKVFNPREEERRRNNNDPKQ